MCQPWQCHGHTLSTKCYPCATTQRKEYESIIHAPKHWRKDHWSHILAPRNRRKDYQPYILAPRNRRKDRIVESVEFISKFIDQASLLREIGARMILTPSSAQGWSGARFSWRKDLIVESKWILDSELKSRDRCSDRNDLSLWASNRRINLIWYCNKILVKWLGELDKPKYEDGS